MNSIAQTDSIMIGLPKCTLCGEPATCMIRDCAREMIENGRYKYTPMNEPEWRCKKHGVSTMYDITSLYGPPGIEKTTLDELYDKALNHIIENEETV